MKLKYFLLMIIVTSLFYVVSCTNNGDKENGDADSEFPPSLNGKIIINDVEYQIEQGGYIWERKKGFDTEVIQTDHASPYQMSSNMESIRAIPKQKVDIKIEDNPVIKVYLWNKN